MTQTAPETAGGPPRIPDDSTFGARLALVRQMMAWGNVAEAAKECGLPVDSWRHWERDNMEPRRLVTIAIAIASRANVDLDWLVYGPNKPGQRGGKLNVDYPPRLDPLAPKVLRRVGAEDKVAHGDFRKRQPNGRSSASHSRTTRPERMVSSANHTAPVGRIAVA